MPKVTAAIAYLIAAIAIVGSYTQIASLQLAEATEATEETTTEETAQANTHPYYYRRPFYRRFYWPRRDTTISGFNQGNGWAPTPNRATYSQFRGGGSGAGK